MAQKYPGSWNNCATCAFWAGQREADYFGQWVTVESSSAKGRCMCRTSGWGSIERSAPNSCRSYEKWAPLRK